MEAEQRANCRERKTGQLGHSAEKELAFPGAVNRQKRASEGANSSGPNDMDLWRQEEHYKVSRKLLGELPEI